MFHCHPFIFKSKCLLFLHQTNNHLSRFLFIHTPVFNIPSSSHGSYSRQLRIECLVHTRHCTKFWDRAISAIVVCVIECVSCSVKSNSLQHHGLSLARLLCPWDSPGKNTGVGCHALLQGIYPTQGSNLGLPYCS